MRHSNHFFWIIFSSVFALIGIALIAISFAVHISSQAFENEAIRVDGTIVDIFWNSLSDSYSTVVSYRIDGEEHTERIGYYSSGMSVGDSISLLVDPEQYNHVKAEESSTFLTVVLLAMGSVFLFIGLAFICSAMRQRRREKDIIYNGTLIYADITNLTEDLGNRKNGKCAIIISCSYEENGRLYLFHSHPAFIYSYEIDLKGRIPVYMMEDNPSCYYVDVDAFIRGRGNEL